MYVGSRHGELPSDVRHLVLPNLFLMGSVGKYTVSYTSYFTAYISLGDRRTSIYKGVVCTIVSCQDPLLTIARSERKSWHETIWNELSVSTGSWHETNMYERLKPEDIRLCQPGSIV